eukprot:m51a1_g7532 hypothetical protein (212) ;mRNA; r:46165-47161
MASLAHTTLDFPTSNKNFRELNRGLELRLNLPCVRLPKGGIAAVLHSTRSFSYVVECPVSYTSPVIHRIPQGYEELVESGLVVGGRKELLGPFSVSNVGVVTYGGRGRLARQRLCYLVRALGDLRLFSSEQVVLPEAASIREPDPAAAAVLLCKEEPTTTLSPEQSEGSENSENSEKLAAATRRMMMASSPHVENEQSLWPTREIPCLSRS